jgi:hypothetical protein
MFLRGFGCQNDVHGLFSRWVLMAWPWKLGWVEGRGRRHGPVANEWMFECNPQMDDMAKA